MVNYASDADVRNVLGTIGNRLPAWVDVATYVGIAHAQVVDRLSRVYPDQLPAFAGDALAVVKYAEAKVAAAEILEAIRVNLPDLGEQPDQLRASAWSSLDDGVIGYPPGSGDVDPGSGGGPVLTASKGPRVSSFTPLSAFPDPYAPARDAAERFQ